MFSTREFEWSNVNVVAFGRPITGIQGISYSVKQEKEFIYGQGREPRAIQSGNRTYEGEIKLMQSEVEALILAAPRRDLMALTFDIIVAYIPRVGSTGSPNIVTDVLKMCEISEVPKSLSQGDKFMEISLPIMFLGIKN